jgi:glycosyltransferase involved in cell wall biosynthesis
MPKAKVSTWIIIPGYNEEKYLKKVFDKVRKHTANIIFVDDGSSDKTSAIAKKYTRHVLRHMTNLGKGAALKTGCEYAFKKIKADRVIFLDSDDQHDPKYIQR